MNGEPIAQERKPYDVKTVQPHPQKPGVGILCRDQTVCYCSDALQQGTHDQQIRTIAQLGVRLINVIEIAGGSDAVLESVSLTKKSVRRLLRGDAHLDSNETMDTQNPDEMERRLDEELETFGAIITRIKESDLKHPQRIRALCEELAQLHVVRVEGGGISMNIDEFMQEATTRTERMIEAIRLSHAQRDFKSGIDSLVVSETSGFPVEFIASTEDPQTIIDRVHRGEPRKP